MNTPTPEQSESFQSIWGLLMAWLVHGVNNLVKWTVMAGAATFSVLSDSRVLTAATVVYTLFLIYFTLRDKWWRQRGKRGTSEAVGD